MKIAVRKEEGGIPGGGFHYMLHPIQMRCEQEAAIFGLMGYHVIGVDDAKGTRLLQEANAALRHQVEVACLVDGPKAEGTK